MTTDRVPLHTLRPGDTFRLTDHTEPLTITAKTKKGRWLLLYCGDAEEPVREYDVRMVRLVERRGQKATA